MTSSSASEIRAALEVLIEPGAVSELRILTDRQNRIFSGYFNDLDKMAEAAAQHANQAVYAVYNVPNPEILPRANNRVIDWAKLTTSDSDIVKRRWLPIDIDSVRPSGVSATEEKHGAAIDKAREVHRLCADHSWPYPLFIDSGNGAYALLRIDLPNDEPSRVLLERCLKALAFKLNTDQVHVDEKTFNAARILRVPGTTNVKGDSTEMQPNRPCKILHIPDPINVWTTAQLKELTTLAPNPEVSVEVSLETGFDLEGFIARHLEVWREGPWQGTGYRWVLGQSPMCEHHRDGPYVARGTRGGIMAGCHHNSCTWTWRDLRERFEPKPVQNISSNGFDNEIAEQILEDDAETETITPIASAPPFPTHCLPKVLQDWVRDCARAQQAQHEVIGPFTLAACSAAIGARCELRIKRGWSELACLWIAVVATPGVSKKTPALKAAMSPLHYHQAENVRKYTKQVAEFQEKMDKWKENKPLDPKTKPAPPNPLQHTIVSDITVEKLAHVLKESPAGAILEADELVAWIGSMNQYKNGKGADRQHYLSMWSSSTIKVDRMNSPISVYVQKPFLSIVGGLQPAPKLIRQIRSDEHPDGLFERVLWCWPDRQAAEDWSNADTDFAIYTEYKETLLEMMKQEIPIQNGDPSPRIIRFSDEGKQAWEICYNEHSRITNNLSDESQIGLASKVPSQAARISLVLQLVHSTSMGESSPDYVHADWVNAGWELAWFFFQHAQRTFGIAEKTSVDEQGDKLFEWIKKQGREISAREVSRNNIAGIKRTSQAVVALEDLRDRGLGKITRTRVQGGVRVTFEP